jgi:hypothetical protein
METKNVFFGKSVLLAIVVITLTFGSCEAPDNSSVENPETGSHDIDSSLYGTWKDNNGGNTLTITFSSNGITWGGSTGSALNIQGATWTAKNGTIKYTWSGGTTTAYNYSISSDNLLLSTANGYTTITLVKEAGSGGTSRDDAIRLTENQWANGNISTSGGQQWFTFTATASTQYIHAAFGTLTELYVQVYNGNGDTAGNSTKIYESTRYTSQSLTSGQTYYIKVWSYTGSGTYQIAFNTSSTPPVAGGGGGNWTPDGYTPVQLTENQWSNGNIYTSDGEQWFTFTATASTQYIHVAFGTLTDLYVQVYNSIGGTVGDYTNLYSSTRYASRSLTSGQNYYIKVSPYSGSGSYQIAFNTSSTPPVAGGGGGNWTPDGYTPVQLTENQWSNGNIYTSDGEQWFTFTATASTQYIHVAFGTLNDLYVQIYDSNGSTVGSSSNLYGSTRYTSQSLTSGQTYYIKVWPYGSNSGSYQIAFNTSSTPPVAGGGGTWSPPGYTPIQLTANQWANGNISSSSGQQWFSFTATASTQYIHVAFGTLNDLYVQIYDSNGDAVGSSSNLYGSTRYTSRSLTSGQNYYIKVSPYGSNSGSYQIAFNTSSTPPVAGGVGGGGGTSRDDAIQLTVNQWTNCNSSQQWFSFTATASTQYIHITFGTLGALYMQVYNGNTTVGDYAALQGTSRYISRSLVPGQSYYIKIDPFGSGNYQIAFNTSSTPPGGSGGGGGENPGTNDIDPSLYGTWRDDHGGNILTITFSSNGITWGGSTGSALNNIQGATWTARNGTIYYTWSGGTTTAYSYTLSNGNLLLSTTGTTLTLIKY